jgi:hypothetical protein
MFSLDLTYYKSSYEDFLPIIDPLAKTPKKKLNIPFTKAQIKVIISIKKLNLLCIIRLLTVSNL